MKSEHADCLYHLTPARNIPAIASDGLIPQIGPRSRRAGETENFVHCFASFEEVAEALEEWVPETFPASERIALLAINLRPIGDAMEGCAFPLTLGPHLLWVVSADAVSERDALRTREATSIDQYVRESTTPGPVP